MHVSFPKTLTIMIRYLVLGGLCLPLFTQGQSSATAAQTNSEEVQYLFKDVRSKLSDSEKSFIFNELEISLSDDKQAWISYELPVYIQIYPSDMNKDGLEEVFVAMSSTALFGGMSGGNKALIYMKSPAGAYQLSATIDGSMSILPTANLGYPDLLAGGPGFEFPVYRWDGTTYQYNRIIKDADYEKNNPIDIADYSKAYSETISDQGGVAEESSGNVEENSNGGQKSDTGSKDSWWTKMKKKVAGQ